MFNALFICYHMTMFNALFIFYHMTMFNALLFVIICLSLYSVYMYFSFVPLLCSIVLVD